MGLRQKLLADAESQLDAIEDAVHKAISIIADANGLTGREADLAKLFATKRTANIRMDLKRRLADNAEARLVAIYNDQVDAFEENGE